MEFLKKYKTIGIIVVVAIVLILSFAVGNKKSKNDSSLELSNDAEVILANAQKESAAVTDEQKKEFVQIDVAKYLEYYAGSEGKLVLLARPTCTYCTIATPIIQKIMKDYDLEISYLNTDNFTEEDQTAFVTSNEIFMKYGTPMLLYVKESTIIDKVDGMTDTAHYLEFLRVNGFIE